MLSMVTIRAIGVMVVTPFFMPQRGAMIAIRVMMVTPPLVPLRGPTVIPIIHVPREHCKVVCQEKRGGSEKELKEKQGRRRRR